MPWLRLIRWKNLAIVFLTQLLVWFCLIRDATRFLPGNHILQFLLLSLSTLLITAAGYIINDYFDIKIDSINRPEKMVLINEIPLKKAIIAHIVLNAAALVLSGIVAAWQQHYNWLLLQLACIILLWFYSTHFKRQYIIGNIVVSVLTAFTIVVLVLYEPLMHLYVNGPVKVYDISGGYYINPFWAAMAYCFFAFMLTWMREIVKDMEDREGDAAEGCKTMPVILGLRKSGRFAQVLGLITAATLVFLSYFLIPGPYRLSGVYTCIFLVAPLVAWCFYLPRKNTAQHYHLSSRWLKIIMLLGICSLIIYHIELNQN